MNTPLRLPLILSLLVVAAVGSLRAQTAADSPETRRVQAERYLKAAPPGEMMNEMTKKITASMPEAQRQQITDMFTKQLDMVALTKAMSDSLVKHFTTEELKALADFYGSPVGKSAMSKFGDYSADLMPIIQAQLMKAQSAKPGPGQ